MNKSQEKFTNGQLGVIAVYLMGGEKNLIDLEDIAMKLFAMTPGRFSLHKYPAHLDIHSVRVTLSNTERLPPHHLTGSIKNGYMLSPEGLDWVIEIDIEEEYLSKQDRGRKGSVIEQFEIEKTRLIKSKAYKLIKSDNQSELTVNDLHEFLKVNEYFPNKKILSRVSYVRNVTSSDEDLAFVWDILIKTFEKELKPYE